MTLICSACGQENAVDETVCLRCGATLVRNGTPFDAGLELQLSGSQQATFRLEVPVHEGYVIGRTDEASEYMPDVDLAPYGARDLGVSRRHIAVVRYRGAPHLVDLNSANGSYLNDKRLVPESPYAINVGDSLKLGNMTIAIFPTQK